MKLSVSLSEEDVAFLDEAVRKGEATSRSALIHHAIGLLRTDRLEADYAAAFAEWQDSEDASLWDRTTADGASDEANDFDASR